MTSRSVRADVLAASAALVLAGCSSSGGGAVSTSSLESKLKNEPQIQTLLSQGGTKAQVTSQIVDCIAKALEKDANSADLKKYVTGSLNLNDVGAKSKGSTNDAQSEVKTCAQGAVKSVASSAPAS